MMGSLVDQVKKEVDEKKSAERYQDYIEGVRGHLTKVQNLQQELLKKLAELEKEEKAKITSESIHDGFNTSHVSKAKPAAPKTAPKSKVELLNKPSTPAVAGLSSSERLSTLAEDGAVSSGAEADVEDDNLIAEHEGDDDDDRASIKLTKEGKAFAKINRNDYRTLLQFISEHPDLMTESTQDALLVEAFNAQMKGKDSYAQTCVHHGLLIQYCRQLGRDGVGMFFKRITTKGHQAAQVFNKDVAETYNRIKTRAKELVKEEAEGKNQEGVEQIQLHAVEPGTEIHINIPQPNSEEEIEIEARKLFESFSPEMQRALETGSLDKVNKVLGEMSVEEAEQVVEDLSNGGMLSLQEGVIDATNEEGQAKLKQIEDEERRKRTQHATDGEPGDVVEEHGVRNIVDEVD
jgi:cell division cycle protein 37